MKKIPALLLAFIIVFSTAVPVNAEELTRDETIYAKLDLDGSLNKMEAVIHLNSPEEKSEFSALAIPYMPVNLTTTDQAVVTADQVLWQLSEPVEDFYYQTQLEGKLPYTFDIRYEVNGNEVPPKEMAGQSGHISMFIDIHPDKLGDPVYTDHLMVQTGITLNLDDHKHIQTEDATMVLVGKSMSINYVLMPGESGHYSLSFDSENFEMSGITFSLIPNTITLPETMTDGLNEFEVGMKEMSEGINEMISGTEELQNGLYDLSGGTEELSDAYSNYHYGLTKAFDGIEPILNGIEPLADGMKDISNAVVTVDENLTVMSTSTQTISDGYSQLSKGYGQLLNGSEQILVIAQSHEANPDPQIAAMASALVQMYGGMSQLNQSFDEANMGITSFNLGISAMAEEFGQLTNGISQTSYGLAQLNSGSKQLHPAVMNLRKGSFGIRDGLKKLAESTYDLPEQLNPMLDGQHSLYVGTIEASDKMNEQINSLVSTSTPVFHSYVSGEDKILNSLQYVITTPSIVMETFDEVPVTKQEEPLTFWDRLVNLFR